MKVTSEYRATGSKNAWERGCLTVGDQGRGKRTPSSSWRGAAAVPWTMLRSGRNNPSVLVDPVQMCSLLPVP